MPHDTLHWSISPVLQDVYGEDAQGNDVIVGKKLYAAVEPVINGKTIQTGWVFDTMSLLVRKSIGYYLFDVFTCSCGIAGCAGIHDEVHLRVGRDEVQLQFPRVDPFLKRFVPKYFPDADAPLIWTFDAQSYHQALDDLVVQLEAIEVANPGIPVDLWADDGMPVRKPIEPVAVQVANAKKWHAENAARIDDSKAYSGPLYQAHLAINIEDTSYNLSVHGLFEAVADTVFGVQSDDEIDEDTDKLREEWIDEQTVYFRQHPEELVALFKSLPWPSFQEHGYLSHVNSKNLIEQLAGEWPNVSVVFVPMEKPEDQDWTLL